MGKRTAHGYPMQNSNARAMDVVALLSGVNFGSVEKVFAALDTLYRVRGLTPPSTISIHNCPSISVFADPKHKAARSRATEQELKQILKRRHTLPQDVSNILMLDLRFPPTSSSVEDTTDDKKPSTEPQNGEVLG